MPARRTGAVIVTYGPAPADVQRTLEALLPQVDGLWVVDNGSAAATVEQLRGIVRERSGVLVEFPENRGLATAQNAGLQAARAAGMDSVLLFDQDSVPAPDMVERLQGALDALTNAGHRVAAVGPRWVDQRTGREGSFYRFRHGRIRAVVPADDAPMPVDFLISSGTLVTMPALDAIGLMREDLFVDHIDTEWCARAKTAGWSMFGVPAARLWHELGERGQRVWLGRWREVAIHSPLRNYYEVRNTLALLRSPVVPVGWRCAHSIRLLQLLAFYGVLVAPRWQRAKAMGLGLLHGVQARSGSFEQASRR